MIEKKSWEEFKEIGLLWWINNLLHMFGWSIVTETEEGKVINVYPARVKFRGFGTKANSDGFKKVSKYMKENAVDLFEESNE